MPLSQLPLFLNGTYSFDIPIFTVWGACEDVQVLEKLRAGEYKIPNLNVIDEHNSRLLDVGGVKLRLLGLGGAVVMHKLFDNGEGRTSIAGGQGTMWTTLLQMGELVDTAKRTYDPSETRVLITHASPAREGLLNQLAMAIKVDFTISAGLHFRYGSSYNEFSVNPTLDHYRGKLAASRSSFNDVWETVKSEVLPAVADNEQQKRLLDLALEVVENMPTVPNGGNPFGGHVGANAGQIDESAFKNMWGFNLADAAFGYLVLEVEGGRVGSEMKAQGFNFAHRSMKNPQQSQDTVKAPVSAGPPHNATVGIPHRQQLPQTSGPSSGPISGPTTQRPFQGQPQQPQQHGRPISTQQSTTPQNQQPIPRSNDVATAKPISAPQSTAAAPSPSTNGNAVQSPVGEAKVNGSAPADDNVKGTPPPPEKRTSQAIFITNVKDEDEAKSLFPEIDRNKITKVEKMGRNFVASFASRDEMLEVLRRAPQDLKKGATTGKPNVKEYLDRREQGSWGSMRGGAGYRSGGASDSESGRGGRGAYRGTRARGTPRGTLRGGRGGSFRGESGVSSPASAAPAASASGA